MTKREMMRFILLVLAALVAATPVIAPEAALAQRRTLFDLLFGNDEPEPAPQAPPQQQPQNTAPQAPQAPRETRAATVIQEVEKNEDATRLLVVGDVMAASLSKALARAFAEDPNLVVSSKTDGSSGFVRDDYYDWNESIRVEIEANSFDLLVVDLGTNDRQALNGAQPLTDEWKAEYLNRLNEFLGQLRAVGKPVVWVGLPPMRSNSYSNAMNEISSLHRLASVSNGAEFVDIYERFTDENGAYTNVGPDLNGQQVVMRRSDGIFLTDAGADKVAFFVSQAMRIYYRGGAATIEVTDPLEGTDAQVLMRLPFQGQGQIRLLEVAGAVLPLTTDPQRSAELVRGSSSDEPAAPFPLKDLVSAPVGRADAFGVGYDPEAAAAEQQGAIGGR